MNKKPLAIDLFCGAGGMSEGIIQAGFHIIFSNDINEDAAFTYRMRHEQLNLRQGVNTWLEVGDIKELTGINIFAKIKSLINFNKKKIKIDAIFGGPPCQGFSRAGKQQSDDVRNTLFAEYLRIVSEVNPKYIVFENVMGITDVKFENYKSLFDAQVYKSKNAIDIIISELKKINYDANFKVLNASEYGVPQNRNRLIIIGWKNGLKKPNFPQPVNYKVSVEDALYDLTLERKITSRYQKKSLAGRTPSFLTGIPIQSFGTYNNEKTTHNKYVSERFSLLAQGESNSQLKKRISVQGIDLTNKPHLLRYLSNKTGKSKNYIINAFKNMMFSEDELDALVTKKMTRIKLDPAKPSTTILTLPDDIISPYEDRIFTVREFARLQSFDDSFIFYGKRTTGSNLRKLEVPQYTQVGNAVPPLFAKAIALEILKCL